MPRLIDALVIRDGAVCSCTDDEGAKPNNAAVFGRDFVATRGLRIRKLPPSIDFRRGHCVQSGKGRDRTDSIAPDLSIHGSSSLEGIRPFSIIGELQQHSSHSTKRHDRIFKGGDVHQGKPMPARGHAGSR
jgi:hypothetical protein